MTDLARPAVRLARTAAAVVLAALLAAVPAAAATNNIFTVAGTGAAGFAGDGGAATAALLNLPAGVAVTADGGFLIADRSNERVRRVSPAGTITTVAGTGTAGLAGDGGPATAAQLNDPFGVAATADGGFLIADRDNQRVRRVSPAGTITTVAGTGTAGLAGDGGPATAAQLSFPTGVAATADGGFLIADRDNQRVRRVSPAGTITTVAGTGTVGFSGDGGPATAAQLTNPVGVTATADGGFLIVDLSNQRVRRVSPTGTITTVAGGGSAGLGDGRAATAAMLNNPTGVGATADGGFLIADTNNDRVRRVSPAGTITTVAGTGTPGSAGDGGAATAALLTNPTAVAATADGGFLIADLSNHRIRFVDADLRPGPQGPQGTTGSPGTPGQAGATGPPGPAGPQASAPVIDRLAIALSEGRYRARRAARLRLRYAATRRATVELRILRGRRRAARARGRSRTGRNQISVRVPRRSGRYRIQLIATTPDGQRATDTATLTVR